MTNYYIAVYPTQTQHLNISLYIYLKDQFLTYRKVHKDGHLCEFDVVLWMHRIIIETHTLFIIRKSACNLLYQTFLKTILLNIQNKFLFKKFQAEYKRQT